MSGKIPDSSVAQAAANQQELVQFKRKMDALKGRLADPQAREKQLRKACKDFEAVFISKLWEQMRATVPKEGYLHSKQEDMYTSMFDQAFSEKMAESGGIGLADMLYENLNERLRHAADKTLAGAMSEPAQIKPLRGADRDSRQAVAKAVQRAPVKSLEAAAAVRPLRVPPAQPAGAASMGPSEDVSARIDELARKIEADHDKAQAQAAAAPGVSQVAERMPEESGRVPADQPLSSPIPAAAAAGQAAGTRAYQERLDRPHVGRKIAKIG